MSTTEKYLKALQDLKTVLEYSSSVNMTQFAKSNRLSNNFQYILIRGKLIKNEGGKASTARYKWNTIEPNLKMAERVLNECNVSTRKSRSGKTTKKPRIRGPRKGTANKYYNYLNNLYESLEAGDSINVADMAKKHRVNLWVFYILKNIGVIVNHGGRGFHARYEWVGDKPSVELAEKVVVFYNERQRKKGRTYNRKKTISTDSKKATIKAHAKKSNLNETQKQTNVRKVSLLWGLVKFETTGK